MRKLSGWIDEGGGSVEDSKGEEVDRDMRERGNKGKVGRGKEGR